MAESIDLTQAQLVGRLADGFAALLNQVDELKRHSKEMEKLFTVTQKVRPSYIIAVENSE